MVATVGPCSHHQYLAFKMIGTVRRWLAQLCSLSFMQGLLRVIVPFTTSSGQSQPCA